MKWRRERRMKFHAPFSYFSHGKEVAAAVGFVIPWFCSLGDIRGDELENMDGGFIPRFLLFSNRFHLYIFWNVRSRHNELVMLWMVSPFLRCLKCVWGVRTLKLLKCLSEGPKRSPPKLSTITSKDEIGICWVGGSCEMSLPMYLAAMLKTLSSYKWEEKN